MPMTHRSILNQLAGGVLVEAIENDVKRCARWARLSPDKAARAQAEIGADVIDTLMLRWQGVLDSDDTVATPLYRHTIALALATALHQQGFHCPALTARAIAAIKALNDAVALSDHFQRRSAEIRALLLSAPVMPTRRPGHQKGHTQWRAGDVASVRVDDRYHAMYVLSVGHGAPIVEFYDYLQQEPPTIAALRALCARGTRTNGEDSYLFRHALFGLIHQPDPAHQFVLLASGAEGPDNRHLLRHDGLYTVSDVFRITQDLRHYP
ncbi:hypothetical protein KQ945_02470 [Bacillus subtilis subsp. subtilis]|nr:hypothetical protein [Bacillus subtilis subsp. subtilis]